MLVAIAWLVAILAATICIGAMTIAHSIYQPYPAGR
jgi:hypothetical protein